MNFRHRLALFLIVTLVVVQALTAAFAYGYLRSALVSKAKSELAGATHIFVAQLALLSEGASDDVKILSQDYALRQAIAQRDYGTEFSALRNHGRRVNATRMMLIDLEGHVVADTGAPGASGRTFQHPDILNDALQTDERTAIVTQNGKIFWIVVVPVRAPVPIAFIAAFIPVDDALLEKMRDISATARCITLATTGPDGRWIVAARSKNGLSAILPEQALPAASQAAVLRQENDKEILTVSRRLDTASTSAPVVAILGYPLDDALAPYWALTWPMLGVWALSLLAALIVATLIVRSVSQPLERLAKTARQIAAGNYAPPERIAQRDELGQLSESLSVMTRSIAEREADLTSAMESAEVARAEAERANLAKSHFLANMSHELRTPLNAIMGFAEMLQQQVLGPIGDVRYREYAEDISGSAQRLLALVSRMLDLADIEGRRLTIARETLTPLSVLHQIAGVARASAERAGVVLVTRTDVAAAAHISGDARKLRQAFSSLVDNAIKFTPRGGQVTIHAETAKRALIVRIEDTGVGIRAEDIAAITRPFHRLRSALDGLHQGAGLGLPFAKAIVELHDGRLEIDSAPGEGTRITVTLPLVEAVRVDAA